MKNMEQQYKQAQIDAQAAGAVVVENVMSCCRGCVDLSIPDGKAHAWSFAGQGNELVWTHGNPFYLPENEEYEEDDYDERSGEDCGYYLPPEEPKPAEDVYWYHGDGGGEIIAKAFRDRGFTVEWDGTEHTAVLVKLA